MRHLLPILLLAAAAAHAAPAETAAAEERATGDENARWLFIPALGYSPDTKLLGGAYVIVLLPGSDPAHRSSVAVGGIVTQRKQVSVSASPTLYWNGGDWRLEARAGYRYFPSDFWGVGRDAPESAAEVFTPEATAIELALDRRVWRSLRLGLGASWERFRLAERETGGLLDGLAGAGGGDTRSLTASLIWDGRDRLWLPTRGVFASIRAGTYDVERGCRRCDHDEVRADLRAYRSLGPRVGAAGRLLAVVQDGSPPFDRLAALGGAMLLRGYGEGRWRDRALLAAQAELRAPALWRSLGLVLFAGWGDVAPAAGDLAPARSRGSAGFGLRWLLDADDGMQLRADLGVGEEGAGFYIGFGEVF